MQIIPAIDIIDGKCVRLTQGDYAQVKIYNEHPLEVAMQFEEVGIQRLHLVDLDGAKTGKIVNWKILESIASKTSLSIDFGGGIKSIQDVNIVFESGANWATIGSMAVKNEPEFMLCLQQYTPEKFLLGADVKSKIIAIHGWQEQTEISIFNFMRKYSSIGLSQIFCTDISKDGKMEGPSTELYKEIIEKFPEVFFIASGGVSNWNDVEVLREIGCSGVIIGKAIYEGKITLKDLRKYYYAD